MVNLNDAYEIAKYIKDAQKQIEFLNKKAKKLREGIS